MSLLDDAQEAWEALGDTQDVSGRDIFIYAFMVGVRAVAEQLNDDSPDHRYKNFDNKGATEAAWNVTVRLDQAYMAQLNDLLGRDPQEHW